MSGAPSSDLEVLQSHTRSKLIVVAAIAAAAAGAWFYTRGGPIGQPEDGGSVLIVTSGEYRYRLTMEELGFKVLEGSFAAFEAKAREAMPEMKESGAAAVLRLADYGGYAFVAFERPQTLDLSGLAVEGGTPTFTPEQRFAVFSAGDYAFPHRVTVTQPRSPLVPGVDLDLLTALFSQDILHRALDEGDPRKATTEVMVLRSRLERAIERLRTIDEAERTVAKIEERSRALLIDAERGPVKPLLLGDLHESIHPIPLADGSILTPSREARFLSRNGLSAELELDETWRFLFYPPHQTFDAGARGRCDSLLGGTLEQHRRRPRIRASAAGDALLIQSGDSMTLHRLDAELGPCHFTALGALPGLAQRDDDPGTPHRSGWVARSRQESSAPADAVLELVRAGDEPPLDLIRSEAIGLGAAVWIDEDHVAVIARSRALVGGQSVLLASRHHPGLALEIGPQVMNGSYDAYEVAAAPSQGAAPRLVISAAGPHLHRLYRVDLPGPLPALFAEARAAAPQGAEERDLTVVAIDPERLTATELTREGAASEPVISPDGSLVAFAVSRLEYERDADDEIAVVRLDGQGEPRVLTLNGLDDHMPLFTSDSQRVVFRTKYPIDRTTWTLTTGRVVAAGEP
ncbi:MAG: hypothetical protein IPK80_08175 [Nannocystis sp.]|nr:hypothetical protein [Nannocystis sp.]